VCLVVAARPVSTTGPARRATRTGRPRRRGREAEELSVMRTLALTVSLKIPDNEARSALEALRVKMGLGQEVRGLAREEVWEFRVDEPGAGEQSGSAKVGRAVSGSGDAGASAAGDDAADASTQVAIERIVGSTNLFANPNKHRYSLAAGGACDVTLGESQLAILVSDRGNAANESMAASLKRLGAVDVAGVRRWTRWIVTLEPGRGRDRPGLEALLQRIAVADARDGGLFCNPHIEEARAILPWGEEKPLVR